MSKLYNTYLALKKQDPTNIYLFKSGIFFIALDKDAITLSNIFNFKLGNLNETVVKCGFPCSSINKYTHLFSLYNINIKIIESNQTIYKLSEYAQNSSITMLFETIVSVDTNSLSIAEAYQFIEDLKIKVTEITKITGENK